MRIIWVVINPISGGKSKQKIVEQIHQELSVKNIEVKFIETQHKGHGSAIAKEAIAAGVDTVVVVGGDGSVHEIGTQLIESNVKLGIVPSGSGNGFANQMGISMNITQAIQRIISGNTTCIDVGKINQHHFLATAGFGFDSHIARLFAYSTKRGLWSYAKLVLREFRQYKGIEAIVTIDQKQQRLTELLFLSIANTAEFGNGFHIASHANPTDGKLELILIKKMGWLGFFKLLILSKQGQLLPSAALKSLSIKELNINTNTTTIQLDGESIPVKTTVFEVVIVPKALLVIV